MNINKKHILILCIFLIVSVALSLPAYAKWRNGYDNYSYKSPCWMPDSQHIIYIKRVDHTKYHHGIIALLSFAESAWQEWMSISVR